MSIICMDIVRMDLVLATLRRFLYGACGSYRCVLYIVLMHYSYFLMLLLFVCLLKEFSNIRPTPLHNVMLRQLRNMVPTMFTIWCIDTFKIIKIMIINLFDLSFIIIALLIFCINVSMLCIKIICYLI